ncbi:iron complex transport system substrate-binding protein [Paenibacillus cellulosilyticus]|uniref:Iron complex transport system substrate-binding protein n=1 Tax=Paenibacillus cellulosilyticus TaxID=375489 RepID=A0A2V2YXM0_9BACL|nr:ABC transporter substrate-binding protein [Paenibacillus cellulosilyticus]PWW06497.1 iron complex transport system substrate-binding protein [Paenibacillus cellulosilyticus]QKS46164.1 ABC transporter substrate-binding protein [Paenibacillus cellulosilyticus]
MNKQHAQHQIWRKLGLLSIVMVLLLLAACGSKDNSTTNDESNAQQQEQTTEQTTEQPAAEQPGATVYPLTLKDDSGTEITLDKAPARIVTLAPSETEIAFAIGAGDSVVGVDEYSNYPEQANAIDKVGDTTTNIEKVTALQPDLILASVTMNTQAIEQLRALKLNVYATEPKTYDAVIEKIKNIGVLLDKQQGAADVADRMSQVKADIESKVASADKPSVLVEFSPGWTVGKGEFMDELLTLAGGTNVAQGNGWYEFDSEQIVKSNPQVIVYSSWYEEPNAILEGINARPAWKVIDAVKNNRLVEVPQDPLSRVGPRLAEGLQSLAKAIHPELFQ